MESGESNEGVSPTIDVGLRFPLTLTPFNGVSFEGVEDGENVVPLEPRLPTLDGRDGGLTIGTSVADEPLEWRFGLYAWYGTGCGCVGFIAAAPRS